MRHIPTIHDLASVKTWQSHTGRATDALLLAKRCDTLINAGVSDYIHVAAWAFSSLCVYLQCEFPREYRRGRFAEFQRLAERYIKAMYTH